MIFLLFDTMTFSLTGIYLASFLSIIHFLNVKEFCLSLILLYLLSDSLVIIFALIIIYLLDCIIFTYVNYNLYTAIITFIIYYLITHKCDIFLFVNLIFVIIMYHRKYNILGENHGIKKVFRKSH